MKLNEHCPIESPVIHTFCEHPGCTSVRMTAELSESKPYCSNHIEEMPYVQQILDMLDGIDPKEDRKQAELAFENLK